MDIYKEILVNLLLGSEVSVKFPDFEGSLKEIIESKCYCALKEIRDIIDDDSLDDPECFTRIEKIVCAFESVGSNGGSRHDFG